MRKIALQHKNATLTDITTLLKSTFHEERLVALLILVDIFSASSNEKQKEIVDFYLAHTRYINNWDLVDLYADKIVGEYLYSSSERSESRSQTLIALAHSSTIWERRISMVATYAFIKRGFAEPTLFIAKILIADNHDLIQKAVGWMLREVGKRVSQEQEETFLRKHYKTMPKTMLRYAIERFPETLRKAYLAGSV